MTMILTTPPSPESNPARGILLGLALSAPLWVVLAKILTHLLT